MLILGFQGLPAMFQDKSRPIIGARSIISASSNDVLFANRPDLEAGYVRLADELAELRPKQVGLIMGFDSWEFPLWYLLRQRLQDSDMPVIVHEMNDQAIDPESDVVVYLEPDNNASRATPDGMIEVPGFGPLRLFQRIR
jgi:hypothetical protein